MPKDNSIASLRYQDHLTQTPVKYLKVVITTKDTARLSVEHVEALHPGEVEGRVDHAGRRVDPAG